MVLLVHVFSLEARRVGVLKQIMSAMRGHQSSYAAAVFTKKETNRGFCGVPCPVGSPCVVHKSLVSSLGETVVLPQDFGSTYLCYLVTKLVRRHCRAGGSPEAAAQSKR